MAVKGCVACVKYTIVLINIIFLMIGIVVLATSIWLLTERNKYTSKELEDEVTYGIYTFMGIGLFLMLISFLGCCGAMRESTALLYVYASLLFILLFVEFAVVVYTDANMEWIRDGVLNDTKTMVQDDYGVHASKTRDIDTMQRVLRCCGIDGPDDWAKSVFNNATKDSPAAEYKVPKSCCSADNKTCDKKAEQSVTKDTPGIFKVGCYDKISHQFHNYIDAILYFGIAAAIFQLGLFVLSLVLCCEVRTVKRASNYIQKNSVINTSS